MTTIRNRETIQPDQIDFFHFVNFEFRLTRNFYGSGGADWFLEGWRLMGLFLNPIFLSIAAILAGFAMNAISMKCKGKNGRNACKSAAWGFWLTVLANFCWFGPIPGFWPINLILLLAPAAIAFVVAANSMLKEMRAQRDGEFTEAA